MKLNTTEGGKLAAARARVIQTSTGKAGNLVDWLNGRNCRVFLYYESIGAAKLPVFDLWSKADVELESKQS